MNWKVRFWELTGWRPKNDEERTKNDEERWRIFTKLLTKTSQKCYGSALAWIFFTETIFLNNFKWILNTRRVEWICSALFPLFIGEKREVALPSVGTPWKVQVGLVAICTPLFTKYTPLLLFCWFFFCNVIELYGLRNDTCFLSVMSRNFTDYATIPSLTSGMLQNFTDCATMLPFDFRHVAELHGLPNDGC